MKCGACPDGRRFGGDGIYCTYYGIIINEKHECTLERGKRHDRAAHHGEDIREETGLQKDGGGAA